MILQGSSEQAADGGGPASDREPGPDLGSAFLYKLQRKGELPV